MINSSKSVLFLNKNSKMKKLKSLPSLIVFLLLITIVFQSYSQQAVKWGKISKAEKEYDVCMYDSLSSAVILSETGRLNFVGDLVYIQYHVRIKILKQNGIENSDVEINYYNRDNFEDIQDIEAQTINIENDGNISTQMVNKEAIYKTTNSYNNEVVKFAFPSVRKGSILEYKYTLVTKNIFSLKPWIFQHKIPTLYSKIEYEIPTSLNYSILLFGDSLNSKYENKPNNKNEYSLENIPGYENEKFVYNPEDYAEQLKFQLLSYQKWEDGGYSRGIENVVTKNTWEKLSVDFNKRYQLYLSEKSIAKQILAEINIENEDRNSKIEKIYSYVTSEYKWNKYYYYEVDQSLQSLIKSKQGLSSEINLLLCLLLNEAGIKSYPVMISTRYHGKMTKAYPDVQMFNHCIVAIIESDQNIFIDAISQNMDCTLLPLNDINYMGFLIEEKAGSLIEVNFAKNSIENTTVVLKANKLNWHLNIKNDFTDYVALNQINSKLKNSERFNLSNLISNSNFRYDSISQPFSKDCKKYEDILYFSSNFKQDKKIFLDLNILEITNEFKEEKRMFPIEFLYPISRQLRYSIEIPEGYKISNIPENKAIAIPNNVGKFVYTTSVVNNQVSILIQIDLHYSILSADYYPYLNQFYEIVTNKLNENLVFESTNP